VISSTHLSPVLPSARSISRAAVLAVAFALAGCSQTALRVQQAFQGTPGAALVEQYPPGSIKSVAVAEKVLSAVGDERARIEANYAAEQTACYPKFFMTSCMDKAREQRRYALAQIRPVEIQAEVFTRRDRVEQRDKVLAEKRAQDEAEAPQRAKEAKEREVANARKAADSARRIEEAAEASRKAAAAPETGTAAKKDDPAAAPATRAPAARRQPRPREAISDEQRAANQEAFEKKARDAKARQEEVAAKKAQKEREIAARKAAPAAP
jgi:colicin import membrane protein